MSSKLIIIAGLIGFVAWLWLCMAMMEDDLEFKIWRRRK